MVKPLNSFTSLSESGDSWSERVHLSIEGSRIFPPLKKIWHRINHRTETPDSLPTLKGSLPTTGGRLFERKKSEKYTVEPSAENVFEVDYSSCTFSPGVMAGLRQRYWPPLSMGSSVH